MLKQIIYSTIVASFCIYFSCNSNQKNYSALSEKNCLPNDEININIKQAANLSELYEKISLECFLTYCDDLSKKSIENSNGENPVIMAANLCKVSDGSVSEALFEVLLTWWEDQPSAYSDKLFQLNEKGDTCLTKFFLQNLSSVSLYNKDSYEKVKTLELSYKTKHFLLKNSPDCMGFFPPFQIVLNDPDTVLNYVKDLEVECLESLLNKTREEILHNENVKAYQFLEACSNVFDASLSTTLSNSLGTLWLTQNPFFLKQVAKTKQFESGSIPSLIVYDLVANLHVMGGFDQTLHGLDLRLEQLDLTQQEKTFAKEIHAKAFEEFEKEFD